uniref:Uncharacterized protein n=1 Tax=Aureoumbra lagunensis TaxID=44058 RepID=A0A7S3K357_9STRA
MYDTYDTDRLVTLDEVINTEENNAEALCLLKKILVLPCMSNAPQRFVRHLNGLAESEESFYMTTNSKRQKYKALLLVLMVLGYTAEMIADHLILVGRIHYKENKDVTVEVPMMEEEPLMDDAIVVSRGSYLLVPSMTVTENCPLPGVFQRVVKQAKLQFSFPSSGNSSSPMLLADAKYADILGLASVAKFKRSP